MKHKIAVRKACYRAARDRFIRQPKWRSVGNDRCRCPLDATAAMNILLYRIFANLPNIDM